MPIQEKPVRMVVVARMNFFLVVHNIKEIELLGADAVPALTGRVRNVQIINRAFHGASL